MNCLDKAKVLRWKNSRAGATLNPDVARPVVAGVRRYARLDLSPSYSSIEPCIYGVCIVATLLLAMLSMSVLLSAERLPTMRARDHTAYRKGKWGNSASPRINTHQHASKRAGSQCTYHQRCADQSRQLGATVRPVQAPTLSSAGNVSIV